MPNNRAEYQKNWRANNREKSRAILLRCYRKLRRQLIEAYGSKCVCCGEIQEEFLTLDHIEGGGRAHILRCGDNVAVYRELRNLGFPKDKYRLLCMNCNLATKNGRICPHQRNKQ